MTLDIYQVDAFTSAIFGGNPAAIVPLVSWLPEELMQKIASENNLSETAFFVKEKDHFQIRWFTPKVEVSLCGHATLATAHVIFNSLNYAEECIRFSSKSGELLVKRKGNLLEMDFPSTRVEQATIPTALIDALNYRPIEMYKADEDYFFVFENEAKVAQLDPNFNVLQKAETRGLICTAKGDSVDFVSRFFAPAAGINEDPVTGSAHTTLIPYWAKVLGKEEMTAWQISERKGELFCTFKKERVLIAGQAISYLEGKIYI